MGPTKTLATIYGHIYKFSVLVVFMPVYEVIRSDLDQYQKKRRQTQQKVQVIQWRLWKIICCYLLGCWLQVFAFYCCRNHFFANLKVLFASCSQRFPINNNFIIVLYDRIWFWFYTFSQDGVSVGMLLGDCWQVMLHCIDVSVFIILLLEFLVKQKPNSRQDICYKALLKNIILYTTAVSSTWEVLKIFIKNRL